MPICSLDVDVFRLDIRSEVDGVVRVVHKADGQWCSPAETVMTIQSGAVDFLLAAPAFGQLANVWVIAGQVVAAGERLMSFDVPG